MSRIESGGLRLLASQEGVEALGARAVEDDESDVLAGECSDLIVSRYDAGRKRQDGPVCVRVCGTLAHRRGEGLGVAVEPEGVPSRAKPFEIDAVALGEAVDLEVQEAEILCNPGGEGALAGPGGPDEEGDG